MFLKSKL